MEHVEIDWRPSWEGSEQPERSALKEWTELFVTAMGRLNRSVIVTPDETRHLIESAGFTDVRQEVIKVYYNPWSPDRQERETARWFNLGFCRALEAMSMMPMIEQLNMKISEVKAICEEVKAEIRILRYHPHCRM
jgi:hypothetical protein